MPERTQSKQDGHIPLPSPITDEYLRFVARLPKWRVSEALVFCCFWRMENGEYTVGDGNAIKLCFEILSRAGCIHRIGASDGLFVNPSDAVAALHESGWRLPGVLVDAFESGRIPGDKAGASPATTKRGSLDIASAISAKAWSDIRVVLRPGDDTNAGGLTFHCGRKHIATSWEGLNLHNADELRGVLMLLAKDGLINWGKHFDSKRRDCDTRRAQARAAGKRRGRVNKLNAKFLEHFPAEWENPFFNDDGVTKHRFQKIEMSRA